MDDLRVYKVALTAEAIAELRASLALDPDQAGARQALRELLAQPAAPGND